MTPIVPQPIPLPPSPLFQCRLRTLLLLCVVLGSSLAMFGALFCGIPGRFECMTNLRHVSAALQSHHATYGCFPAAYVADKNGAPLRSWRVALLGFLGEDPSIVRFYWDEPWNSPRNKRWSTHHLSEYACPSEPAARDPNNALTSYLAVVGPNAAWSGEKNRKLADFGDEASATIMLIEVANAGIQWAEPRDLSLATLSVSGSTPCPVPLVSHKWCDFFFVYDGGVHVALADGTVHFLQTENLSSEDLRKVLSVGGCKNVPGGPKVALNDEARRPNWPNIAALAVWLLSTGTLLIAAVRSRKAGATSSETP
jgi:hypothetical protein